MRISQKAKNENRNKLLKVAANLFADKGFEKTTTRDIAASVGMAAGTMFNYFENKEALAMTLVVEALTEGRNKYETRRTGDEDFHEELFLLISSELRSLRPFQKYIGPVLERAFSLFPRSSCNTAGELARQGHFEIVEKIIARHEYVSEPTFLNSSIYWSLYIGILAFWSTDDSRNQEETLALMDYSLRLFAQTLEGVV